MLEGYIVTLADGSEGTLMDFYNGIVDNSIDVTDSGFVLSDGSLVQTNGVPYYPPSAEDLIVLMSPYLSTDGEVSDSQVSESAINQDELEDGAGEEVTSTNGSNKTMKTLLTIGVGYLLYTEFIK